MSILLNIFGILFIIFEACISAITFYYLKLEYAKVVEINRHNSSELEEENEKLSDDTTNREEIVINTTQYIDTYEINKQIAFAQLTFTKKDNFLFNAKITRKRTRIGRDPRNDIKLSDHTISRKQCLIDKEGDKFILRNYSHINTTRINGKTVKKSKEIKDGDVVQIGNVKFRFNSMLEVV